MKKIYIKFHNIKQISDFVKKISMFSNDVNLISGRRYVDGKSFLGICSFDISKKIKIDIIGTQEEAEKIINLLKKENFELCK